jgi:hypothetical protein
MGALTLILTLRGAGTDPCNPVEERRFSRRVKRKNQERGFNP